jgi:dynein heavy chain
VNDYSDKILDQERRFVYTTPKSFLELIKLFKVIQAKKEGELVESKEQYELGVVRLTETAEIVAKLEEDLKLKSVEVEAKKKEADEQATIVGAEKVKVEAENAIAEEEAGKCKYIKDTVEAKMSSVQKDLDLAIPLVEKAQLALAGLKITDFRDLKALKKPPAAVSDVFTCVLFLLCGIFDVIPIDKAGKLKTEDPWKVALATMKDPQAILDQLNGLKAHIDDESIHPVNFKQLRPYIENPEFTPEIIFGKSQCCAGLCDFVINITQYYDVVVSVEPKKQAVREAQEQLATANEKKKVVDERVAELNAMLAELISVYNKAMAEKEAAVNEAARCERKLDLAQRLVGALGTEADRWA